MMATGRTYHMTMRESFRFLTAGLSLMILVGCSENTVAPTAATTHTMSAASAPRFDYNYAGSWGDQSTSFVATPAGGTYAVNGLFNITFPAGSICDPDLSTYGEGTWDTSCVPLNRAIRITATTRLSGGGMAVDFSPELRFVPTSQVVISTDVFAGFIKANRAFFAANPWALRPLALYYSPTLGGSTVADYISDYSLVTHVNLSTGRVSRRVKHFSGYNITSGQACDPAAGDPDCIQVDGF